MWMEKQIANLGKDYENKEELNISRVRCIVMKKWLGKKKIV